MKRILILLTLATYFVPEALADRGSIPFKPGVEIYEPNQRALIAWNGEEEILLLSTDLYASEATRILEVLPLPAEPQVTKGNLEAFVRANKLIQERTREPWLKAPGGTMGGFGSGDRGQVPAGEVTFHQQIGPHEISVTRVNDTAGFVAWVQDYLQQKGVPDAKISDDFCKLITAYLRDQFQWFVFDIVELSNQAKTLTPIRYRFKTKSLFYPLRITRLEKGRTTVDLIVLTPRLLSTFPGLPANRIKLRHRPFPIAHSEVVQIDQSLASLFALQEMPFLRIWRCEGLLSDFQADLIARE